MKKKDYLKSVLPKDCNEFRNSSIWKEAYELYMKENPTKRIRIGCSSCCKQVLNWIRS